MSDLTKSIVLGLMIVCYFIICSGLLYLIGSLTVAANINGIATTIAILFIGLLMAIIPFISPFKSVWYDLYA